VKRDVRTRAHPHPISSNLNFARASVQTVDLLAADPISTEPEARNRALERPSPRD
jgi:hypothetical protein